MSNPSRWIAVFLFAFAGLGVGYWLGGRGDAGPTLPPSRSRTMLPDDFAPPGVAGEVRRVLLEQDFLARTAELAALLGRLGPESLEGVREAFDSVLLDLGDTELVLFAAWWADFDPETALAWTYQNWSTRGSPLVTSVIMRTWARSDPMAAMAKAASAPNNWMRRQWVDNVLRGWDESVHDGALEWAESLAAGPERQWALYVVTRRRVLRDGPAAALTWAEALPDDDELFKLNAFRRVTSAAAEVDPQQARAFAERHLEGPYGKGLPMRVGTRWVVFEPEAAMRWLSTLSAGANRDDGVLETYRVWLMVDKPAAQTWIEKTPRERWLDPAISLYAKDLGQTDPAQALRWATQIEDPDLRDPTLGWIIRPWLLRDEPAANAWLGQSSLPDELVQRIRVIPPALRGAVERGQAESDREPSG